MNREKQMTFGFDKCYYAPYTPGTAGAIGTWAKPKRLPGAVSLGITPEGSRDPFFADNGEFVVRVQDNGFSGNLTVGKFPDEFLIKVLNWVYDKNKMLIEAANVPQKQFALLFELMGTEEPVRVVVYHCSGAKPTKDIQTTTTTAGLSGEQMAITATTLDFGWITTARSSITKSDNSEAFEKFFDKVMLPERLTD